MNQSTPKRRGGCPSLSHPMGSGDGLLVRLHPRDQTVTSANLRVVAEAAARHGNGLVEITQRANFQIRGIRDDSITGLREALKDIDLKGAHRLNVLASPLCGIDPTCLDLRPIIATLMEIVEATPGLDELPPKFSVLLDGGGRTRLDDVGGDIRFTVEDIASGLALVSLGGTNASAYPIGACRIAEIPQTALVLLRFFLSKRCRQTRRMRDFVHTQGLDGFRSSLAIRPHSQRAPSLSSQAHIGLTTVEDRVWFGIGIPFGSGSSAQWLCLSDIADRFGNGEIRLTPWRAVLLPLPSVDRAEALADHARSQGFIVVPEDPRRSLLACAGQPACGSADGPTREIALALAQNAASLLDGSTTLHVSGCDKGCARAGTATITLVADPLGYRLGFFESPAKVDTSPRLLDTINSALRTLAADFSSSAEPGESAGAFLSRITLFSAPETEHV